MSHNPITFSLPGVDVITTVSKRYDTLTDEFIQQWLLELMLQWNVVPDYLLVNAQTRDELHRLVMNDLYMYSYVAMQVQGDGQTERYFNRVTGTPLTIVVFPGLPEKTLYLASMLKIAKEHDNTDAFGHTVVQRTYAKQEHS